MLRLLITFFMCIFLNASAQTVKQNYPLTDEPIDVVIVTHPKDKDTLEECIEGLKKNGKNFRRFIIVSSEKLSENAEWVDEKDFPFSKEDVALKIARGSSRKAAVFFKGHYTPGWYYQQLLKLYSVFLIPGISSNVLVVDSDTIFMNPVEFMNEQNGGLFCVGTKRVMPAYFAHAARLVPGYKRINPEVYSVCHHMLFQRPILEDLFRVVEEYHGVPFWEAFCQCVDKKKNSGASEFEIYYNFALTHTDQVAIRELKWKNSSEIGQKDQFEKNGFHYVSFHTYMRKKIPPIFRLINK